jgi:HSP20 family protein
MSNIIHWEPARDMVTLREAMNRLFDDSFTHPLGLSTYLQAPPVDLYQTDDEVIVHASMPGFKPEDVQISVTGDLLTLKGEFKE